MPGNMACAAVNDVSFTSARLLFNRATDGDRKDE